MRRALRDIVVPELRQRGYRGTFPRFRRTVEDEVQFVHFVFWFKGGNRFLVELRRGDREQVADMTNAQVVTRSDRVLLRSPIVTRGSEDAPFPTWFWFEFEDSSGFRPDEVAARVVAAFDHGGADWWTAERR